MSQLAQIAEAIFEKSKQGCIRRLNKAVKYAVDNRVRLKVFKLDGETLKVVGYSDSSFANNTDLTAQLGHIVLLSDSRESIVPLSSKSYKSRRVTRSAMAGEVIASATKLFHCRPDNV